MPTIRYRNFQPSRAHESEQGTVPWVAEIVCPVHGEIALDDVDLRPVYGCDHDWQQPCCRKCNEPLPGLPEDENEREIHRKLADSGLAGR